MSETAVVICPGRGSYGKEELGYLKRATPEARAPIDRIDDERRRLGRPTVTELDGAEKYSPRIHTAGENASALIYACSRADFLAIDRERFEIVAVTGNSMGWYAALAVAGALDDDSGFKLVETMGAMMAGGVIGGQIIYPVVDGEWRPSEENEERLRAAMEAVVRRGEGELHLSIDFGGYRVIGGDERGLRALAEALPRVEDRYPMRLVNHAAFHTPMMREVSERAFAAMPEELFGPPRIPLIDGCGAIRQPYSTDPAALRDYTLGRQVVAPYSFSTAVEVALREFAPSRLILLGPGAASGGAIGQILVKHRWMGIDSKSAFVERQREDPYLLEMGREAQRSAVCADAPAKR
jgi:acyl transferase domain-containing protein